MENVQIGLDIHIKLILLVHKIFNQSEEWNKKKYNNRMLNQLFSVLFLFYSKNSVVILFKFSVYNA